MAEPGWTLAEHERAKTRQYVIRLPGAFLGQYATGSKYTCFQTIVSAENEQIAWEIACSTDIWETLPFKLDHVQIFPKDPLQAREALPERRSQDLQGPATPNSGV